MLESVENIIDAVSQVCHCNEMEIDSMASRKANGDNSSDNPNFDTDQYISSYSEYAFDGDLTLEKYPRFIQEIAYTCIEGGFQPIVGINFYLNETKGFVGTK